MIDVTYWGVLLVEVLLVVAALLMVAHGIEWLSDAMTRIPPKDKP